MSNFKNNKEINFIQNTHNYLNKLHNSFSDEVIIQIMSLSNELLKVWKEKKVVYVCGNGGSAANAIHIANDFIFGAGACGDEPSIEGLRIEALSSNSAILTCIANDVSYEEIFSTQIKTKGNKGDILIVLSGSGNSKNIINAVKASRNLGIKSFAILGYDGGICKDEADEVIHFKVNDMQIAEDCQLIVGHICMQFLNTNKPI